MPTISQLLLAFKKYFNFSDRALILAAAKTYVGYNLAPGNELLGCVISVNAVVKSATGSPVCLGPGTRDAIANLIKYNYRWQEIGKKDLQPGDIIISVTEFRGAETVHGHIGIVGEKGKIYSNNSYSKVWDTHFTLDAWFAFYERQLGLQTRFFRSK